MKVIIKTATDKDYGHREYYCIEIDGKEKVSFMDGEPEDACLGRDFNDCYSIPDLMQLAYDTGVKGEDLEIEKVEVPWDDI